MSDDEVFQLTPRPWWFELEFLLVVILAVVLGIIVRAWCGFKSLIQRRDEG